MKKSIFMIGLVLLICIILSNCNKKQDEPLENVSKVEQNNEDYRLEQKLIKFLQDIRSGNRSGEYDVDSAKWYVEATANYEYGDAAIPYTTFAYDSVFITAPITNGKITSSDVSDLYDEIIDSLEAQYDDISSSNKHLVFADVRLTSEDSEEASFCVYSGFSYGGPFNLYGNFYSYDNWNHDGGPDNDGGYCEGIYNGQRTNSDGAMELSKKIRYRSAATSGRYYFKNIITLRIEPTGQIIDVETGDQYSCDFENPDDITPDDNLMDYLMYHCCSFTSTSNMHDCIPYNEMNFYKTAHATAIDDVIFDCVTPLTVGPKERVNASIVGWEISNPNIIIYWHVTTAEYGTKHYTSTWPNNF